MSKQTTIAIWIKVEMEYYDEVVEIEDTPGNIKSNIEPGIIDQPLNKGIKLDKPPVK